MRVLCTLVLALTASVLNDVSCLRLQDPDHMELVQNNVVGLAEEAGAGLQPDGDDVNKSLNTSSVSLKLSDSTIFAGEVSLFFPSLSALFVVFLVLGTVGLSAGMYMQTKSRYACGASLIVVGVVCCVVATAAIMADMSVKKQSGAEPAYVPPPKHSAGNLVVSMESRFTERELNTPGPIRDTYVDAMQLALDRLPNLATTPTVSGLTASSQFPVLLALLAQPVNIEYHIDAPKETATQLEPHLQQNAQLLTTQFQEDLQKAAQNTVEQPNVNDTRLSDLAGNSNTVEVTNVQLVTPALIRCSAMLNVGATIVDLARIEIQKRAASVIDMLTEFATNELEDMEGELAGRCNSLAQQQAMRVCVGLDMIWLDFVSRRPLPLEDGETTVSKLCPIAKRLTNLLQNHSAEAFRQINDQIKGFSPVTLSDEVVLDLKCEADLPEGEQCPVS